MSLEVLQTYDFSLNDLTSFISTQAVGGLGRWRLGLSFLFGWWKTKVMETLNPKDIYVVLN